MHATCVRSDPVKAYLLDGECVKEWCCNALEREQTHLLQVQCITLPAFLIRRHPPHVRTPGIAAASLTSSNPTPMMVIYVQLLTEGIRLIILLRSPKRAGGF
jgi:hypothetical protein